MRIVRRRHIRRPGQVMAQTLRVGRVRHVVERRFQRLVLNLLFFTERHRSERSDAEQRRNVSFACGRGWHRGMARSRTKLSGCCPATADHAGIIVVVDCVAVDTSATYTTYATDAAAVVVLRRVEVQVLIGRWLH